MKMWSSSFTEWEWRALPYSTASCSNDEDFGPGRMQLLLWILLLQHLFSCIAHKVPLDSTSDFGAKTKRFSYIFTVVCAHELV
ncbi:hypothetical protein OUZ56_020741 [Daphnia magna]|uniref:Uncharacterized protein n=1 Tax=Daphnia magna TaxID=35525 RepID=A0ABQ9ZFC2_9CRUS|nr:hypothetical protein OUZ56_020741 [Daphnia magna]